MPEPRRDPPGQAGGWGGEGDRTGAELVIRWVSEPTFCSVVSVCIVQSLQLSSLSSRRRSGSRSVRAVRVQIVGQQSVLWHFKGSLLYK